jgi:ethanolamine ammonia-lyase small subunit
MKSKVPSDSWATMRPVSSTYISLLRNTLLAKPFELGVRLYHLQQRIVESFLRPFSSAKLQEELTNDNWIVLPLSTLAQNRQEMLEWPKRTLALDEESSNALENTHSEPGKYITIIIQDGLSSAAVEAHSLSIIRAFHQITIARGATFTPVLILHHSSQDIAEKLGSRWPINWILLIKGENSSSFNNSEVSVHFYDMAFGEGIKKSITLSEAKSNYKVVAQVMAEALWTESARLGLFPKVG